MLLKIIVGFPDKVPLGVCDGADGKILVDELESEKGTEDKKRKLLGDGPRVVDNDGKDGSTVL